MIKLIDNFNLYDFSSFEDDVFFLRIYSDYKTLSSFDDAMFYVSLNGEKVIAVISKIGGNVTLSAKENAPFEEISEFLKVVGYKVILCDNMFSEFFCGKKTYGSILKITSDKNFHCKASELYSENLKDTYCLIKNIFHINIEFPDWFADMSHKLRHGGARLFGIYSEDRLISAAFSLFETEKSAVISSLATHEEYRCNGYGERVVKTILDKNIGKDVYVFTENEKIDNWYKKMGFTDCKKWSEVKNVL